MTYARRALTSDAYRELLSRQGAMVGFGPNIEELTDGFSEETMAAAHSLALDLPEFTWTIEVDVLGHHRITLHFKGGTIDVD